MSEIKVEHQPSQQRLNELGVTSWGIWEKEESSFPWTYDATETCYFLEGDVVVTPDGGEPVQMGKGDMVTFPAGMSCHWEIKQAVRKHFMFA
ncbi:MAG: cupin domain-containing protein [Gammaproteobacteria bacterium]|nr:cupin domain-containing protein [Gammaproteobacteria bacterium]MDH5778117.1 cupin domain-containing protein [Gammaproteobacteria bacterium]